MQLFTENQLVLSLVTEISTKKVKVLIVVVISVVIVAGIVVVTVVVVVVFCHPHGTPMTAPQDSTVTSHNGAQKP